MTGKYIYRHYCPGWGNALVDLCLLSEVKFLRSADLSVHVVMCTFGTPYGVHKQEFRKIMQCFILVSGGHIFSWTFFHYGHQ